jgi:thiosulfate/3-mercaptopyruvate sulfurtransferase
VSLISAAELAGHLAEPDLRIADVRWSLAAPAAGRAEYAEAHLPGAVFVDLDTVLTAPVGPGRHPLPDPAAFAEAMGALGIGRAHRVVAYDDAGGTVAARLWWMLEVLGHPRTAVLDGGIAAWRTAGLPLTVDVPSHPMAAWSAAGPLPPLPDAWPGTIDRAALTPRLGALTLLDARAPERYRGEIEPIDPVAGHIPTAVSAPTASFLDRDGCFLAPAALAARFAALGAAGARPVVVACGSGVNACQLALAMRVAGLADPLLYPGSYSDWSRSGMPIATGDAPGEPPSVSWPA